jgi:type I restriction enzyme S subunit
MQDGQSGLLPKLRFPEFRKNGTWNIKSLEEVCDRIVEKVGGAGYITVSITAGRGFVSQFEKFGRDISGAQYKNYIHVKRGDFAYNKGNSNLYPQGCVYQLTEFDEAAASNAFICFRLKPPNAPGFYVGLFEKNTHGKQLIRFLTSGARSDGLLNIKPEEFFSVKFPIPRESAEQHKIASCLSTLDELIGAQGRKVAALRTHKKGLMQQLFPREGETQPRLRFPEFQDAPEWESQTLGHLFETTTGGTPRRAEKAYWNGDIPWVTTSLVDFRVITEAEEFITKQGLDNSSAKLFPKGTVLMALYGQGKTRGQVAVLGIQATTNQACAAILPRTGIDPYFLFLNLSGRYEEIRSMSNSGGQENLSQTLVREIPFTFPNDPIEQYKITSLLTSLDELITAEMQKLEALKTIKRGLMQQLFPSPE